MKTRQIHHNLLNFVVKGRDRNPEDGLVIEDVPPALTHLVMGLQTEVLPLGA